VHRDQPGKSGGQPRLSNRQRRVSPAPQSTLELLTQRTHGVVVTVAFGRQMLEQQRGIEVVESPCRDTEARRPLLRQSIVVLQFWRFFSVLLSLFCIPIILSSSSRGFSGPLLLEAASPIYEISKQLADEIFSRLIGQFAPRVEMLGGVADHDLRPIDGVHVQKHEYLAQVILCPRGSESSYRCAHDRDRFVGSRRCRRRASKVMQDGGRIITVGSGVASRAGFPQESLQNYRSLLVNRL
jgi:hypothetical protein